MKMCLRKKRIKASPSRHLQKIVEIVIMRGTVVFAVVVVLIQIPVAFVAALLLLLLFAFFLFLASSNHQIPKCMPNLLPCLFVGHDDVVGRFPSSGSIRRDPCARLLLEESGTDLILEHPNDGFDDFRLVFSRRRVDVSLQIHLDSDSEASVSNKVVGAAVSSTDNVVFGRFRNNIPVERSRGRAVHVVNLVHNIGGSVDDFNSRLLVSFWRLIRIVAHTWHRLSDGRHHIAGQRSNVHRPEEISAHEGIVGEESVRRWDLERNSHIHGSVGFSIGEVFLGEIDGMEFTEGVNT